MEAGLKDFLFKAKGITGILKEEKPTEKGKRLGSWIIRIGIAKKIILGSLDDSETSIFKNSQIA